MTKASQIVLGGFAIKVGIEETRYPDHLTDKRGDQDVERRHAPARTVESEGRVIMEDTANDFFNLEELVAQSSGGKAGRKGAEVRAEGRSPEARIIHPNHGDTGR